MSPEISTFSSATTLGWSAIITLAVDVIGFSDESSTLSKFTFWLDDEVEEQEDVPVDVPFVGMRTRERVGLVNVFIPSLMPDFCDLKRVYIFPQTPMFRKYKLSRLDIQWLIYLKWKKKKKQMKKNFAQVAIYSPKRVYEWEISMVIKYHFDNHISREKESNREKHEQTNKQTK